MRSRTTCWNCAILQYCGRNTVFNRLLHSVHLGAQVKQKTALKNLGSKLELRDLERNLLVIRSCPSVRVIRRSTKSLRCALHFSIS